MNGVGSGTPFFNEQLSRGWNYDPAAGKFWANSDGVGENTW